MTTRDRPTCRFCGTTLNQIVVDLGTQPLANSYLTASQLSRPEPRYLLCVRVCHECWLVQTDAGLSPEAIFKDYAYFSSYSDLWLAHAERYCEMMLRRFELGPQSKVIEVASNDGYLLANFVKRGIPCLGIEPAENVAAVARANGVPTDSIFLGRATALDVVSRFGGADLVVANNVLAHVPDIDDFVAGLAILLSDAGVLTIEFPHLVNMIERTQFDTIYHEHFSYLSLCAVERILASHGLFLFDVDQLPTHGGSLRIYAAHGKDRASSDALLRLRQNEEAVGVNTPAYYEDFGQNASTVIAAFRSFLVEAKTAGKSVAAYGAAAKGNTLLNASGATTAEIAYVVDRSPHKQGTWLPGSHLPVLGPEHIAETRPDYVVILPWNLKEEVAQQMNDIKNWGGQFVVAIPELQVFQP